MSAIDVEREEEKKIEEVKILKEDAFSMFLAMPTRPAIQKIVFYSTVAPIASSLPTGMTVLESAHSHAA